MHIILNKSKDIIAWLEVQGIDNKCIKLNTKGPQIIVDVAGSVDLKDLKLKFIPVQFGLVEGDFRIANNNLTSLKGCPKIVGNRFSCSYNRLTSLSGGPDYVGEHYYCIGNKLTNLESVAYNIKGALFAGQNNLNSLEFLPLACSEINLLTNPLLMEMQNINNFDEAKIIQKALLEKLNLLSNIALISRENDSAHNDVKNHKI